MRYLLGIMLVALSYSATGQYILELGSGIITGKTPVVNMDNPNAPLNYRVVTLPTTMATIGSVGWKIKRVQLLFSIQRETFALSTIQAPSIFTLLTSYDFGKSLIISPRLGISRVDNANLFENSYYILGGLSISKEIWEYNLNIPHVYLFLRTEKVSSYLTTSIGAKIIGLNSKN